MGTLCLALLLVIASAESRRTFPNCNDPLGMEDRTIPDNHIRASSTLDPDQYGPHKARLNASTGWCSSIPKGNKEFLEVDLGRDMRVSAVATQGVWVRNASSGRFEYHYMSKFFLSYKRSYDESWRWRLYMENEVSVTLFSPGNHTDVERHDLLSPHIARYVRFVAHEGHGSMWCLKVELYGCPWTDQDGLVSYRVSQGNGRSDGTGLGDLRDVGYDGRRLAYGTKRGVLSGGLGQLVDGVLGKNVPWNDTGNPEWIYWVGWRDPVTESPSVTFQFSTMRKFSLIRFHVINQAGVEKLLFGKVVISFSEDGEYYAWKTVYEPSVGKRRMKNRALFLEVDISPNTGKYVTCDFIYHGWWVLLSEVQIVSVPMDDLTLRNDDARNHTAVNTSEKAPRANHTPTTDVIWEVRESGTKRKGFINEAILIASIVGGLAAAILLIAALCLYIRRRKRHTRGRSESDEPLNPLRIINPSKKNSLNRRNDPTNTHVADKLKQIEQEEQEDEAVFDKLSNWDRTKCNELLIKKNDITAANIRPQSRDMSLEEEKANVLAEMRKLCP
ncbi:discoidin domain-containing receptor 2 [Nematostella vectensis]|uniref:discoidin domain-containing receptor 2 n=1 Tax=Nematostella vectensis TaxID=45351 RepID=UPI00207748D2|nr:discoidin domain-containing receptor 2 [Nematostella vectensis]